MLTENIILKQLGILYKVKTYLNLKSIVILCHPFTNTHLNNGNIAWASAAKAKLKMFHGQRNQAVTTVFNEIVYTSSDVFFGKLNALNIYKLNIFQNLIFMFRQVINPKNFKIYNTNTPHVFLKIVIMYPKHKTSFKNLLCHLMHQVCGITYFFYI